jgi:phosphoglycerate-specific signal transduction histidine kinase
VENENLMQELIQTNSGTIALYNDLNNVNEKLKQKNEELNRTVKELKETQDKLVKSERMAAVGNIVVTYNHQINNPLMVILGNVQYLLMSEKNLNDKITRALTIIEQECNRISEVITKIRDYEELIPINYLNTMYDIDLPSNKQNNSD